MIGLELVLFLLAVSVGLRLVAERLRGYDPWGAENNRPQMNGEERKYCEQQSI